MTGLRLLAMMLIFIGVSIAWLALGGSMVNRTDTLNISLSDEMANLWGPKAIAQQAPFASDGKAAQATADSLAPSASAIAADIEHANRYKGLLWFSTFTVKFCGKYTVPGFATGATESAPATGTARQNWYFVFPLPLQVTNYHEQPRVLVDGKDWAVPPGEISGGRIFVPISHTEQHVIDVTYSTGAQDAWVYYPSGAGEVRSHDGEVAAVSGTMAALNDFNLTITTNFAEIDYPKGTRSPTNPAVPQGKGMSAHWQFGSAMTNQAMGVTMPHRQNAGPIAARMSFFAPVSLLFFFTAIFTVVILKRIPLHPMHYLFISLGFFAFHILMAYLVDLVNIHAAFWICAAVSVLLVVSYLRIVAGMKFAVLYAGMAQMLFLVGFSYAFFWTGYTGLTVTAGAIISLFVIMQATGRVNWNEVFKSRRPSAPLFAGSVVPGQMPPPLRANSDSKPPEPPSDNIC